MPKVCWEALESTPAVVNEIVRALVGSNVVSCVDVVGLAEQDLPKGASALLFVRPEVRA